MKILRSLYALFAAALLAPLLLAQTSGTISGTVTHSGGGLIP